jgi:hypothetical protein
MAVSPSLLSSETVSHGGSSHNSGYIAVAGAAGYVHLMNGKMKTWVGDVKLSSVRTFLACGCCCCCGHDRTGQDSRALSDTVTLFI